MSSRQIIVSFKLHEKKIGNVDVAGLAEFKVFPQGEGIGKKALHLVEAVADPNPVVGFAEDDVVGFYEACEWIVGPTVDGKHTVMSEPVDVSKLEGEIW